MRKIGVVLLALFALPVLGEEYEQLLLPFEPSVTHCAYESRYETRLVAFNPAGAAQRFCYSGRCRDVAANSGMELSGEFEGGLPLPTFIYMPKGASLNMSVSIESSEQSRLDERSYNEMPVISTSQFTDGKTEFLVRMDPEFRQSVRIYGLDGKPAEVMMRVYPLDSDEMLHSCVHYLDAMSTEVNADGLPVRPSLAMECDMREHVAAYGQRVRIELEPITPGLKYWAFISVTNNKTQHFYTLLPQQ
jgi:hypothetical protein